MFPLIQKPLPGAAAHAATSPQLPLWVQPVAMCEPAAVASVARTRSRQQGPGGSPSQPWKSVNVDTRLLESQASSSSGRVAQGADNDAGQRLWKCVVQQILTAGQCAGGGKVNLAMHHHQTHQNLSHVSPTPASHGKVCNMWRSSGYIWGFSVFYSSSPEFCGELQLPAHTNQDTWSTLFFNGLFRYANFYPKYLKLC